MVVGVSTDSADLENDTTYLAPLLVKLQFRLIVHKETCFNHPFYGVQDVLKQLPAIKINPASLEGCECRWEMQYSV